MFKRFLSDSGLIEKAKTTSFFEVIKKIGAQSEAAWGLILIQLAYTNPQIRWYIDNMPIGEQLPRAYLTNKIMEEGVSAKDADLHGSKGVVGEKLVSIRKKIFDPIWLGCVICKCIDTLHDPTPIFRHLNGVIH